MTLEVRLGFRFLQTVSKQSELALRWCLFLTSDFLSLILLRSILRKAYKHKQSCLSQTISNCILSFSHLFKESRWLLSRAGVCAKEVASPFYMRPTRICRRTDQLYHSDQL